MREALIKFIKFSDKINTFVGVWSAQIVIIMMLIVVYEVMMRKVFNSPTIWAFELSTFFYGGMFILGAGYAHLHDAHVSIDVFEEKFPDRVRCWLRIITFFIFFIPFVGALFFSSAEYTYKSWVMNEHSWSPWKPPIYLYKAVMPIGFLLLLIEGVAKLIKDILYLKGEKI